MLGQSHCDMKIRWLDEALQDLQCIHHLIVQNQPNGASDMIEDILSTVELLSTHPALGRVGRVMGTRELVITRLPYLVPYRVKANTIEILRVLHSARQWPKRF